MIRRKFLRNVGTVSLGSVTIALPGCTSDGKQATMTPTPPEIPTFHATNSNIFSDIKTLERGIHEATNQFRIEEEQAPLGYNEDLANIARYHSRNMAKKGFFAHVDHKGRDGGDRADHFGYPDTAISENLLRVTLPPGWDTRQRVVDEVITGWKESLSHRAALLTTAHIVAGVGGYITEGRETFITMMFADVDGEITS